MSHPSGCPNQSSPGGRRADDAELTPQAPPLEEILVQQIPQLEAFVRRNTDALLRERHSVSDLVMSVCAEVLERFSEGRFDYRGRGPFSSWLRKVAASKLQHKREYVFAEKRDPRRERPGIDFNELQADASEAQPDALAEIREEFDQLGLALQSLPEEYQRVIFLARIAELPHREIAQQLGRSEAACRQLLRRAIAALAMRFPTAMEL